MARFNPTTPDTYVSPLAANTQFTFVNGRKIFPNIPPEGTPDEQFRRWTQKITLNGAEIDSRESTFDGATGESTGNTDDFITTLQSGTYIATYEFYTKPPFNVEWATHTTATYRFIVVENKLPLKNWTVTDVINRGLDLCEPIRKGERPRFRLNGMRADGTVITEENKQAGEEVGQAALFDTVLAPQFGFTKLTLREYLQEIGKVIHGEPRLIPRKDENGYYYEVKYDIYGSGRMSKISRHKPYKVSISYGIESFCSALDSSAENLINTLGRYGGVVAEPNRNAYKSVRTENLYVRVTDSNLLIQTIYPIYSVTKLEYDNNGTPVDITPYIFESSEYSRLSSYDNRYPQSKIYALRYTQGKRNIDGLNFKRESALQGGQAFGDYSIVAILKKVTGDDNFSVSSYPEMQFRVTYTPIYNTRVSQTKLYYKDVKYKADLFFNQQSNLVETKYYGENLKGAVARLGNVDKAISYKIYRPYAIPKAGDMYDDNYMISAVAIEYMPTYIDCTIALTKSFNRLSQYIGVSSEKRYSEVSETQATERNLLYREYVVIGAKETPDPDSRIGERLMASIAETFMQGGAPVPPISCVAAWGSTYGGSPQNAVILPVISSAFGNSISFSWQYADNYSAGDVVKYQKGQVDGEEIEGYFQNTYPYTDVYGRLYYYDFDLQNVGAQQSGTVYPALSPNLKPIASSGFFSTVGQEPYILRKDNREALQVSVQVDFVTNLKDMIIGSALASNCLAVRERDNPSRPKLYVFPDRLDKFIDHVEGSFQGKLADLPSAELSVSTTVNGVFSVSAQNFPADGMSWAIVTDQTSTSRQVEDEKGNVFTQTEVTGGDVLLARNIEVSAGQAFEPIYFTRKREIFDKTVWKDRR